MQEARDLVDSHGISDRVVFTGFVPFGKVSQYISCMDVCLIPLVGSADCQHAFPVKLMEYMACGKPVISTPLAGVAEAVGDRVLYASDGQGLAERVLELYGNSELRKKLGLQGKALVERNYTWPQICARFENVLVEMQRD